MILKITIPHNLTHHRKAEQRRMAQGVEFLRSANIKVQIILFFFVYLLSILETYDPWVWHN